MAADAWARGLRDLDGGLGVSGPRAARRLRAAETTAAARRAGADAPRRVAFDLLRAVEEKDAYANLALPGLLRDRGLYRPGRRVRHRTGLRDPARPRQLRRSAGGMRGPAARAGGPTGPRSAAPRRPPAARDAGPVARRGGRDRRAGPGGGRRGPRVLRQRRPPTGRAPGPGRLDGAGRTGVRRGPGRSSRGRALPPDLGGVRVRATRSAARCVARRRCSPPTTSPAQVTLVARPGRCEPGELLAAGAVAGRFSPYAAVLPGGDPGALAAVARGARRRPGRGQPARRAGPRRRAPIDGRRRPVAGPVRRPGRQGRPARARRRRARGPAARHRGRPPHRAAARRQALGGLPAPVVVVDATAPGRLAAGRASTGSWSTRRAPGWAPCAAAPRRAGGGGPRTSPRWRRCSGQLLAGAVDASGPAGSSPMSPARRTWPRPATSSTTCCAAGRDVERARRRGRLLPGVPDLGPAARTCSCGRTVHGTDAMFLSPAAPPA